MLLKDYTRSYVIAHDVAVTVKDFYIDYDDEQKPVIGATWTFRDLKTGLSAELIYDRYILLNERGDIFVHSCREKDGSFNFKKLAGKLIEENESDRILNALYISTNRADEEFQIAYFRCRDVADVSCYANAEEIAERQRAYDIQQQADHESAFKFTNTLNKLWAQEMISALHGVESFFDLFFFEDDDE